MLEWERRGRRRRMKIVCNKPVSQCPRSSPRVGGEKKMQSQPDTRSRFSPCFRFASTEERRARERQEAMYIHLIDCGILLTASDSPRKISNLMMKCLWAIFFLLLLLLFLLCTFRTSPAPRANNKRTRSASRAENVHTYTRTLHSSQWLPPPPCP